MQPTTHRYFLQPGEHLADHQSYTPTTQTFLQYHHPTSHEELKFAGDNSQAIAGDYVPDKHGSTSETNISTAVSTKKNYVDSINGHYNTHTNHFNNTSLTSTTQAAAIAQYNDQQHHLHHSNLQANH
jgi:hypothetical protein